ncbi:hypothetical protein ACJMK2_013286 [Sinanodonta woodiana]|uniref:Uncharacterized protein n=1 Tax=Sinanodonta woodiana TaxID=1069815 RepID=A0ABD3V0C1_SINWO
MHTFRAKQNFRNKVSLVTIRAYQRIVKVCLRTAPPRQQIDSTRDLQTTTKTVSGAWDVSQWIPRSHQQISKHNKIKPAKTIRQSNSTEQLFLTTAGFKYTTVQKNPDNQLTSNPRPNAELTLKGNNLKNRSSSPAKLTLAKIFSTTPQNTPKDAKSRPFKPFGDPVSGILTPRPQSPNPNITVPKSLTNYMQLTLDVIMQPGADLCYCSTNTTVVT